MTARLEKQVPGADPSRLTTGMEAVFDGRWHFLLYGDGRKELYDIANDPDERTDLAPARPDEVARLTKLLKDAP